MVAGSVMVFRTPPPNPLRRRARRAAPHLLPQSRLHAGRGERVTSGVASFNSLKEIESDRSFSPSPLGGGGWGEGYFAQRVYLMIQTTAPRKATRPVESILTPGQSN